MTWLCPRPCENKTSDGYCGTSWCINPMYSNIGTANEKLMGGLRKTTNADRIRSMTDEELAAWFTDKEIKAYERCGYKGNKERFEKQWLEWLKREDRT